MLSDKELFESLDLDLPELASVKSAVEDGKLEEAKRALGTYIRGREAPGWLVPAADRPTPTKKPEDFPEALKFLNREFTFDFHGAPSYTTTFGEKIDWVANPTEGEYKTHLWNESLNRHFHFARLVADTRQLADRGLGERSVAARSDSRLFIFREGHNMDVLCCGAAETGCAERDRIRSMPRYHRCLDHGSGHMEKRWERYRPVRTRSGCGDDCDARGRKGRTHCLCRTQREVA